jgi:hypothetical protein
VQIIKVEGHTYNQLSCSVAYAKAVKETKQSSGTFDDMFIFSIKPKKSGNYLTVKVLSNGLEMAIAQLEIARYLHDNYVHEVVLQVPITGGFQSDENQARKAGISPKVVTQALPTPKHQISPISHARMLDNDQTLQELLTSLDDFPDSQLA